MLITTLDFILINCLSYITGIGSGVLILCKYKDNFMIRSRSRDNLNQTNNQLPNVTPVLASAPPPSNPVKITLE